MVIPTVLSACWRESWHLQAVHTPDTLVDLNLQHLAEHVRVCRLLVVQRSRAAAAGTSRASRRTLSIFLYRIFSRWYTEKALLAHQDQALLSSFSVSHVSTVSLISRCQLTAYPLTFPFTISLYLSYPRHVHFKTLTLTGVIETFNSRDYGWIWFVITRKRVYLWSISGVTRVDKRIEAEFRTPFKLLLWTHEL